MGITKHANGTDYWVISHPWDSNLFYSYWVTASGLNPTPIVSVAGLPVTGSSSESKGILKISPSGSKIATTNISAQAQLMDFNNNTGLVSNAITLIAEAGELYGAAFSPDESKVYISNTPYKNIYQFNLNATDIPGSRYTISENIPFGQIQLGPDQKLYVAQYGRTSLGVINNPDALGVLCNWQPDAVSLGGRVCWSGLPTFNQSFFFIPNIQLSTTCAGESASFSFSTNQTVISSVWDFGDGGSATGNNPSHVYTTAGTYSVSVTGTTALGTGTNTRQIVIIAAPTLLANTVSLKQCDDNNDGFSAFNLNEAKQLLVPSSTGLNFKFFETSAQAQNDQNPIANLVSYQNQTVSNDEIFVRVENSNGCFKVAMVNLIVSTTMIPASFQRVFTVCDDAISGSSTDGIATFNFSNVTSQVQALFPAGQLLNISYYKNQTDALAEQNASTNTSSHTNTGYPNTQNIYIRVDSVLNNECLGLGHHITLNVETLPMLAPLTFRSCDDDHDAAFPFNTSGLNTTILNGQSNITLSYFDANNNPLPSPLPTPFNSVPQIVRVRASNNSANGCYVESTVTFIVDALPEAFPIASTFTTACDDEPNPAFQNGVFAFDTSTFQTTILGGQTAMNIVYRDQNGNVLPSPLPNPFVSASQNITVEVINPTNPSCKASITVALVVNPVPAIKLNGTELVCSDNPSFTKTINAGLVDESQSALFNYQWSFNGQPIPNETDYELTVNTSGTYTAEVTNANNCTRTRTVVVTASDVPTIDNIAINDLADINSVIIYVSGLGTFLYSLDNVHYQTSNTFLNIEAGVYTIYVKDDYGCGTASREIAVLGIPKFFTPNGDGFNDFWNIKGTSKKFNAQTVIHIYDRYGKLLKQISPISQGWDGTFNNKPLPSSDYWYLIQLEDGRIFKGHFALKR